MFPSSKALVIGSPLFLLWLAHAKSLPLGYTLRSWLLLRSLVKQARQNNLSPAPLFGTLSQEHRCLVDDMDYNQHMNNSSYNKMLDFSRIEVLYSIFSRAMLEPDQDVFCHNAGVVTLFKKEIPPFQKYTIEARVYTWNEKWLFLEHRFVYKRASPQNPGEEELIVACAALSKMVFKRRSGKTILPADVLRICGHDLTDPAIEQQRKQHWDIASHALVLDRVYSTQHSAPWLPARPAKI
ncbi:hypothetical protein BC940DRAFT_308517 [Gongronella butleri]|nr:hypothetical protein BC940DRAFT_308517 [Gongronella butleri]